MGASKTIGSLRDGNHGGQIGGEYTGDNHKAAVIGGSTCTVARKLEQGTTPAGGASIQGWRASAAPLPDIPLSAVDELPPPLLDYGQGKKSSTKGVDSGKRGRDEWLQVTVSGDREQLDKFWTSDKDMTAKRDCIPASDASQPPNSVDLPQSKTTPSPSSVVPPSGENLTVNADTMVNGVHPPLEQSYAQARKEVAETTVNRAHPPLEQSSAWARKEVADTAVNGVHPSLKQSSAWARKRVRWQDPVQCSAHNAATTSGRPATLDDIQPPILLAMGHLATGAETKKLRLQNKRQRHTLQDTQVPATFWTAHTGTAVLPPQDTRPHNYRNKMCPAGIATAHPAGPVLTKWSQMGCPTQMGNP